MGCDRVAGKILDRLRLRDVNAVGRHLGRARFGDLGGCRLQAGLVAIGQREVAAARGQFQRERAADAAGGAGHGGGSSTECSHQCAPDQEISGKIGFDRKILILPAGFGNRPRALRPSLPRHPAA
jgi:hypothetical protein